MEKTTRKSPSGLDGVVVADTRISAIDGRRGQLVVRGLALEDLVAHHDFEAASHLVITGRLPDPAQHERWRALLDGERSRARRRLRAPEAGPPMNALMTELARLEEDPNVGELERAAQVISTVAVASAAQVRALSGRKPGEPGANLGHAEDWYRLALGVPRPAPVRALERYLLTVLEHGMNASTFATRVVASTGADLPSAVAAGVAALRGPLHGGAPGPVLDMIDAVGEGGRARAWLENELGQGRRIMGFGHRVYRVRDPRARVLEHALTELSASHPRLELARALEAEAVALLRERYPQRELEANVEFFTALLLEVLGIPREAFSLVFATGRVVGWCAHYFEQQRDGRLIRPLARYIGEAPEPPPAPAAAP